MKRFNIKNRLKTIIKNKRTPFWINILLSGLGAIGITWILEFGDYTQYPTSSFFLIIIWAITYIAYHKRRPTDKRTKIFASLFSIFLSTILIIGRQLELNSKIFWNIETLIKIFLLFWLVYIIIEYVLTFLSTFKTKSNFKLTKKQKILIFCIIFISNFLIWLALFPGIYGWDSARNMYDEISGDMTSHWSVMLGYIFTWLMNLGKNLFNDYQYGLAICMFLQMLIMSLIYSRIVLFVTEISKNKIMTITSLCFFVLILQMGAMTIYSTQDTLFGGIFALIFIEFYKFSHNPNYFEKKRTIIYFIVLGTLLCLCRNNGVYVLIITTIAAIILGNRKISTILIMTTPIVAWYIVSGPIYDIIGIADGSTEREIASIPSQQIAKVYTEEHSKLDDETIKEISYFYGKPELLFNYMKTPEKADNTKRNLSNEKLKSETGRYFNLWLNLGIKHPKKYAEAFLLNSLGAWYPNKKYYDTRASINYLEYKMSNLWKEEKYEWTKIERNSQFPLYEELLNSIILQNNWQNIPIIASFSSIGFYFIILTFSCTTAIYNKRKQLLIPLSLGIGLYITVFLAPCVIFRYCYPVAVILPIIITTLFPWKTHKKPMAHIITHQPLKQKNLS
ncbi:hypothetical protein IKF23_02565 [Candidatus Saccharibacteria bacterium]|nr:hypothetical protein [Candidatus Saccharibacteria bacterium]